METTQGVIGLTIKERSKNKNTIVKYDPKSVQAWLNNLPMANIGEVSRAVFQALTEFNQTEVGCGERYKCLLQFEKVVEFVRVALKKHYLGHSVALTEKQRKIASLAQALDNEMAIGYKTVVEDAAAKNILLKDKKLITTALYHAMDYLSKILLRCYQLYSTAPKKIWQETHLLFAYAIDQNYQGSLVAVEDGKKKRSIESLYLKIILLTLANPYQLRQKDIDLIYSSLNDLISMISLEESTEFDDEYIIDLTSDNPPMYHDMEDKTQQIGDRVLKVGTSDLISYLQEHLNRVPDDSSQLTGYGNYAFNPIILRHLIAALGKSVNRSFSRTPVKGTLRIAVGLAATHYLISETLYNKDGEAESDTEEYDGFGDLSSADIDGYHAIEGNDLSAKNSFTRQLNTTNEPDDPWLKVARPANTSSASKITKVNSSGLPNSFAQQNKKLSYTLTDANIINISPGGYCLALNTDIPSQTEAGEIIGILNIDTEQPYWSLAAIRWMKSNSDKTLVIGIQLITPKIIPIFSQVRDSRIDSQTFQRSLLIPEIKGLGQPQTILTPPVPYRVGQRVRFSQGDDEYSIKLTKLLNSTHSYKQFEFDMMSTNNVKPVAEKEEASAMNQSERNGDDFDSVWDML